MIRALTFIYQRVSKDVSGGVTAEFAMIIPAFIFLLVFALSSINILSQKVGLEYASTDLARLYAREENDIKKTDLLNKYDVNKYEIIYKESMVCVFLYKKVDIAGIEIPFQINSKGCAYPEVAY